MTAERAWQMIQSAQRILMTTHVKPDGDGLGSLAALAEALAARGKQVQTVLPSAPGPKYTFMPGTAGFEVLGKDVLPSQLQDPFDLMIVVDTCTWSQLADMVPVVKRHAGAILVIDHHPTRDDLQHVELVDTDAAATASIVVGLLDAAGVPLTAQMAEALMVSLASDTGWFRFPNVTAEVFRLAGRLQTLGASPQRIYERLYQSDTAAKLRLLGEGLSTLAIAPEGDVACFWLSRAMFARAGAQPWETENLINESQVVAGVNVSVMLVEKADRQVRVSLRSKRELDCSALAAQFGGGGHARAAGCTIERPLDDARRVVLAAIAEAMGRDPAANDWAEPKQPA